MKMERFWVAWLLWAAMVVGELQGLSGCVEKERLGLMELGKSIQPDQFTALPKDSECCSWVGVNCSASTGRVRSLSFHSSHNNFLNISLLLPFEELLELNLDYCGLRGLINQPDLAKLRRLETLSMISNNLINSVSLQHFANMKNLKYLTLDDNYMSTDFKGICEMNNIIYLSLSFNAIGGHLPSCIGNLTQLQHLDLSYNQISGNIPSTIGNLSRLSFLSLTKNYFSGSFSLHSLANNSKLEHLYLSSGDYRFQVETETQSWFPSFQLLNLELTNSNLNNMSDSVIPTFLLHQSKLIHINLSHNNLRGTFPHWLLQNNSRLAYLLMSNNFLTGNLILPNFIHGLLTLDISNNKIDDKLSENLQVFLPVLRELDISRNRFQGNLPSSLGALNQLGYVNLSFNSFSGTLPKTLFAFANNNALRSIDLSNNLLDGEISLDLTTLPSLYTLVLKNNKFNGSFEELPSRSSSHLAFFDVSNNLISDKLSYWIANFSNLILLSVSNNSFEGGIPDKLCNMSNLAYLDISHNNLSGSIPSCLITSSIRVLYMRKCGLSGVIPDGLSINSTLRVLDLSYNDFSPNVLPNWIYGQRNLQILLMAGIQLEGEISKRLCGLKNIQIMDLSHNNFNGTIPYCLFERPFWATQSQLGYIDSESGSFIIYYVLQILYPSLEVEFTTKGRSIIFPKSILNLMNGLDVSSNKLSGQIPPQIGDSEAIRALNLSNNRLWGSIPSTISKLGEIESLDLSSNNLCGEIPPEMVGLNFLSSFDVSNNNLSGPVPNGGQFSNFDERNYGGNELLCGPPLRRPCTTSPYPSTPLQEQHRDDEAIFERTSFWWSFAVAFVTVVVSLVVFVGMDTHLSWAWFRWVDVVCSKLVFVLLKLKFVLHIK